ncbi:MAG: IS1096 element passenger TnpR family protein [Burkholderiaceae bacterium]
MECVRGAYLEEDFLRVIEVSSEMRLSELHLLIKDLIGFSDGQLDDCFMATRLRGKKIRFMPSNGHPDVTSLADMSLSLAEIFPAGSRKRLFYSFDFGDNWIFEIKKTAETRQPVENAHYPRIVQEEGMQPI